MSQSCWYIVRGPNREDVMTETQAPMPSDFPTSENAFPFDPRDPLFRANPYPVYNALRDNNPVLITQFGAAVLSKHRDCVMVLHHKETSNDQRNSALFQAW